MDEYDIKLIIKEYLMDNLTLDLSFNEDNGNYGEDNSVIVEAVVKIEGELITKSFDRLYIK